MAALTDLSFQLVLDELPAGSFTVVGGKVMLDVSIAAGITADALTDTGFVKLYNALGSGASKAQTKANIGQVDGEKLNAFSSATIGTAVGGFVNLKREFNCRAELTTATNIIGSNS